VAEKENAKKTVGELRKLGSPNHGMAKDAKIVNQRKPKRKSPVCAGKRTKRWPKKGDQKNGAANGLLRSGILKNCSNGNNKIVTKKHQDVPKPRTKAGRRGGKKTWGGIPNPPTRKKMTELRKSTKGIETGRVGGSCAGKVGGQMQPIRNMGNLPWNADTTEPYFFAQ